MKKSARLGILVLMLAVLLIGAQLQAQDAINTTYNRIDEVMDWGTATTKLIVNLQADADQGSVTSDTFSVYVTRSDSRLAEPFIEEGQRVVIDAYISDAEGNPVDTGSFATLVMEVGPTVSLGQALNYGRDPIAGRNFNAWSQNEYTITQENAIGEIEGLVATEMDQYSRLLIDEFELVATPYQYEDEEYGLIGITYAHYVPDTESAPLLVWLHGGGEGGSDPSIPLAANRAAAFASEEMQAFFGGAYILVPQAPTFWQDTGFPGDSLNGIDSIYTRALQNLVESYVAENPGIDTDRIYMGGLSNGGFQTVRLLLDYPDYYAAAIAICSPFKPGSVNDAQLSRIADIPLWLVTAANDPTVPALRDPLPFYHRLIQLDASDVQLSFLPHVIDETGLYFDEDGATHEYNGHWSWIYVYNNELAQIMIDGKNSGQLHGQAVREAAGGSNVVTIMEWLAAQSK
jgi:predicted peptidase